MAFKNRKVSVISQSVTFQTNVVGDVIPPGSIQAFMGWVAPSGWAFCHGQSVSRTTFSALFNAIGNAGGNGDGVTTFNIPDLRGVFLRGLDLGRGVDGYYESDDDGTTYYYSYRPSHNGGMGSLQGDAIRNISGATGAHITGASRPNVAGNPFFFGNSGTGMFGGAPGNSQSSGWIFNASRQVPTGHDNRPVNVAVNYIIKL